MNERRPVSPHFLVAPPATFGRSIASKVMEALRPLNPCPHGPGYMKANQRKIRKRRRIQRSHGQRVR